MVRGANAYVPPGARRTNSNTLKEENLDIPSVSVNTPDGSEKAVVDKTASSPSAASNGAVNAKVCYVV